MVWLWAPPSDHDPNVYDVPPDVCAGALSVCWKPLTSSIENGVVLEIPSISSVSPLGTVSNVWVTLSGKTKTDDRCVSPSESVTVRMISYRVKPEKSWPEVGMSNVKFFTPLIGPTAGC